jgi:predicted RNA binding protein YcfA (HicA-like mRNA interferase family)
VHLENRQKVIRRIDRISRLKNHALGRNMRRDMKVREVIRLLEQNGWALVRTKGSHRHFRHSVKPGTVTVAGKMGLDVPIGTLNSILKEAGLNRQ